MWFIPAAFEDQGQDLPLWVSPRRFALRVLGAKQKLLFSKKCCHCTMYRIICSIIYMVSCNLQVDVARAFFFKKLNFNSWNQEFLLVTVVLAFWVWSDFAQALNKCTQKASDTWDTTKDTSGLFPGTLVVVDPSLSWQELLLLPKFSSPKETLASTRDAQQVRVDAWHNSRFAFFESSSLLCVASLALC